MYEGMVDTGGLIMWSRKDETHLLGPLQPLTMCLIPCGVLWSFLSKYMHWVLILSEGCK